jgi:hypothetical protein
MEANFAPLILILVCIGMWLWFVFHRKRKLGKFLSAQVDEVRAKLRVQRPDLAGSAIDSIATRFRPDLKWTRNQTVGVIADLSHLLEPLAAGNPATSSLQWYLALMHQVIAIRPAFAGALAEQVYRLALTRLSGKPELKPLACSRVGKPLHLVEERLRSMMRLPLPTILPVIPESE